MTHFGLIAGAALLGVASVSHGAFIDTYEDLTPGTLGEGNSIVRPALNGMNGNYTISAFDVMSSAPGAGSGDNDGLAIFNSSAASSSADPDLLVGSGNILVLQDENALGSGPGNPANDANEGGRIRFDFSASEDLTNGFIDLVDFNGGSASTFTLTDSNLNTRVFSIPDDWTGDPVADAVSGINRLFFNLNNQAGNGPIVTSATFVDAGPFDISSVDRIDFDLGGSGGLDNFAAVPMTHPAALAGVGLIGVAGLRRRR